MDPKIFPLVASKGEVIVAMVEHQGAVYVASSFHVWKMVDGVLVEILFVQHEEPAP